MKLVADIGGTHARFALLDDGRVPTHIHNLLTADFKNLSAAMAAYFTQTKLNGAWCENKISAVISIAAPLAGDRVKMTNAAWDFSMHQTKIECGLQSLRLINDFEALALAVPTLQAHELTPIGHALPLDATRTKAIVGSGTGLGMAGVMPALRMPQSAHTTWHAIACEGGHASFSPSTEREAAIWKAALTHKGVAHICWEDFLSGTGLPHLHRAVCAVDGFTYQAHTPAQITDAALTQGDATSLATLHTFCDMLGSAAGNCALMMGARGGLYIKGGVLDRVQERAPHFLQTSQFRTRFEAKGAYADYMKRIPTWFINTPQIALRGCASLL